MDTTPSNSGKGQAQSLNRQEILELIKDIGQHERHFNSLNGTYKAMASTWLLAVFGGVGFVLTNKIEPWLLYTSGIGLAGGVGIILLWIIDIKVYQQLLASAFTEGLKLEIQNEWLPRTRHNMVSSMRTGSVTASLSWFYVLGVTLPLLIFNLSISTYILFEYNLTFSFLTLVFIGTFILWLVFKIRFTSKEESLQKQYSKMDETLDSRERILIICGTCILFIVPYVTIYLTAERATSDPSLQTILLKTNFDYLAPDGSEIRLLSATNHGSLSHCVMPPSGVSRPVQHKTVEEIWYVLNGQGEIWRKNDQETLVVKLSPGTSITIPVHTKFQFRNTGPDSLKIILLTMPPWPGPDEAFTVQGHWNNK